VAQLRALRAAAAQRGWGDVEEFVDVAQSGAKASRPALDELRRKARHGQVDTVLVAGLDRLGRSLRDLLTLLDDLTAAGCCVVSLREGIDLGTAAGRLQCQLLAAFAEFERELIRERVAAGMARAKAEGRHVGRPRRAVPGAEVIQATIAAHGSMAAAARALGVPRATLARAAAQKAN
jgi:DNA invertase Pin-like site-specific DNA recombinase